MKIELQEEDYGVDEACLACGEVWNSRQFVRCPSCYINKDGELYKQVKYLDKALREFKGDITKLRGKNV